MPTNFGELTLGAGVNTITASGYGTVDVTLQAHPSNSGIIYLRDSRTTGSGYPLSAGASVRLSYSDLHDYTASGVIGGRLAWAANR